MEMSFVIAAPELVQGAAQDLAGIRSSLVQATTAAAAPTTGIAAAAQDEVSVAIASLFGNFGQEFQGLSAQAQGFHAQFVTLMHAGGGHTPRLRPPARHHWRPRSRSCRAWRCFPR
jgi:hypothetical protein